MQHVKILLEMLNKKQTQERMIMEKDILQKIYPEVYIIESASMNDYNEN